MTGAQLREAFLKYFEERGHTRVPSSSLIPAGDATLLFTNAGMVPFKDVFTGQEKRPYKRATTAQKCLRVSGKHNDLKNVGYTARHHTFFEMLGNFSFGDYFKTDAIAYGWGFLTDVVKLPKNKLHVTIFRDDDEAYDIWRHLEHGPNKGHISRLDEKDNFWSMGDTGPCGPCSEIHIDQGESAGCGRPDCAPGCDCDRFLELWNLVFMQYDRDHEGKMTPLPRPSIDTGLGLERLAAVVQGKKAKQVFTNWDSDLFLPVIQRVEALSGRKSGSNQQDTVAIRVIADHSRSAAFLIADGVFPSNEGRGYVLRRILRRAVRYGMAVGLADQPFLYDTAGVVIEHMSEAYPELSQHAHRVEEMVKAEEERFQQTLVRGAAEFDQHAQRILRDGGKVIPGDAAFLLYDAYGFPLDVTVDMAREKGLSVDEAGFNEEMSQQRERARSARKGAQGEQTKALRLLQEIVTHTVFTGYERMEDSGLVKAILKGGQQVQQVSVGDHVEIVTDRTPFYGESGGQVGDQGTISNNGDEITVESASKPLPNLIVHHGVVKSGHFKIGDQVNLRVGPQPRRDTMANHSATHILQWALRQVLGDHVNQSGSVVEPDRLRFDFTHYAPISAEELAKIEDLVNARIRENAEIQCKEMPIDEALAEGATALFGEKYGTTVRVVSMGDYSKELCGGTHAHRTGDIGLLKIVSEGGIAAGVRRIEAVTGRGALDVVRAMEHELAALAERLRGSRGDLVKKVEKLLDERKTKDREIETLKGKLASGATTDLLDGLREVNGIKALARVLDNVSSLKDLRDYADRIKDRLGSGVALLGAAADGKALLTAVVTKDLTGRFHAGNIVKKAAEVVGGSGGGRPDMAQAGGPEVSKLEEALKTLDHFLS